MVIGLEGLRHGGGGRTLGPRERARVQRRADSRAKRARSRLAAGGLDGQARAVSSRWRCDVIVGRPNRRHGEQTGRSGGRRRHRLHLLTRRLPPAVLPQPSERCVGNSVRMTTRPANSIRCKMYHVCTSEEPVHNYIDLHWVLWVHVKMDVFPTSTSSHGN